MEEQHMHIMWKMFCKCRSNTVQISAVQYFQNKTVWHMHLYCIYCQVSFFVLIYLFKCLSFILIVHEVMGDDVRCMGDEMHCNRQRCSMLQDQDSYALFSGILQGFRTIHLDLKLVSSQIRLLPLCISHNGILS